jgi:hypothetical protein
MQEDLLELDRKKTELTSTLESQLANIKKTRTKTDERKVVLSRMTEEFETQKAKIFKEIQEIHSAAAELSQNPDKHAAMDQLPELLEFEEEKSGGWPVPQPKPEQKATLPKPPTKKKPSRKK